MKLYWLDLETTGLSDHSRILEIAVAEAELHNPYEYKHIYNESP